MEIAAETANRRMGESAKQPLPSFAASLFRRNSQTAPRIFNQPLVGLVDHLHELADYFFVRIIDAQKLIVTDIAVVKREFQMNLCFRRFAFRIAQFRDKRRLIAALPPRLGNVRTN